MTAPYATCHRCERDLYPRLAKRSDEGWACAVCPIQAAPFIRCADCHHAVEPSADGLCITCSLQRDDNIGLNGGEWVHDGLILRWQEAS